MAPYVSPASAGIDPTVPCISATVACPPVSVGIADCGGAGRLLSGVHDDLSRRELDT